MKWDIQDCKWYSWLEVCVWTIRPSIDYQLLVIFPFILVYNQNCDQSFELLVNEDTSIVVLTGILPTVQIVYKIGNL